MSGKRSQKAITEVEEFVREEIRRAVKAQRAFDRGHFRFGGARDAVAALLEAGAIREEYEDDLRQWMREGGGAQLHINMVAVVPPDPIP